MTKVCRSCNKRKRKDKFGKLTRAKDGLENVCLRCRSIERYNRNHQNWEATVAYKRSYNDSSRDKNRDYVLRTRYGISLVEYEDLHKKQKGLCAICAQPETLIHGKSKKPQPLAVDHCHVTGRVRGLLCFRCNIALGKFRDDPKIISKALAYVTNK